jgi:hypothetical protein
MKEYAAKWASQPRSRYDRTIGEVTFDVYDVLAAFRVACPARQHAIKKLLDAGNRGHKSEEQDLQEALVSVQRAIQLASKLKGGAA